MKLLHRPRRTRATDFSRKLTRESHLSVNDLIYPIFISDQKSKTPVSIESMPNIQRQTLDSILYEVEKVKALSICAIAIFPAIDSTLKTKDGKEAFNSNGLIPTAIRTIKKEFKDIGIIADVALDPYTDHGHDGLIDENGDVVNDLTVKALKEQALVLAAAGADVLAPSDMMDGRIGVIRQALEKNDFQHCLLLSYAAKYASHFYGPFRDAVGSKVASKTISTKVGVDKRTYQMDFHNSAEAISEVELDLAEGADWLLIKPGIFYLDILHRVKTYFQKPTFSYQVSGEYAMLQFAAKANALDYENTLMESLVCFKRAGADGIFTYGALDAARILKRNQS